MLNELGCIFVISFPQLTPLIAKQIYNRIFFLSLSRILGEVGPRVCLS